MDLINRLLVLILILRYINLVNTQNGFYWPFGVLKFNTNSRNLPDKSDIIYYEDDEPVLSIGDYCHIGLNQIPSVCVESTKCPLVLIGFHLKIPPPICSVQSNVVAVCCPLNFLASVNKKKDEPIRKSERTKPWEDNNSSGSQNIIFPTIDSNGDRISAQSCRRYSERSSINCAQLTNKLIVGGVKTNAGDFVHMAAIGWTIHSNQVIKWKCGGILISDRYVLTAGHCTSVVNSPPDVVRLGDQQMNDANQFRKYKIKDITPHPNYSRLSHYNDIALLLLDRIVQFNSFVRPACLWQTESVHMTQVIATGWGHTEFGGQKSNDLLKVTLDIIDNNKCNESYRENQRRLEKGIINTQICAGYELGGRDTCQGDSGGPIQLKLTNECLYHIIGVTSFGKTCGKAHAYGVYTRVSAYLDWIESVVWRNGY